MVRFPIRGIRFAGIGAYLAERPWERAMEEAYSSDSRHTNLAETPTFADQEVLERAITKLVLLGKQVGVSAEQMIEMLEGGLSVVELVEYLASRNGNSS